jgi:hypothetical protein
VEYLNKEKKGRKILVIVDGVAFGSEIEKLRRLNNQIDLYLPESFEQMILKSGIMEENKIKEILNHPEEYIESKNILVGRRH